MALTRKPYFIGGGQTLDDILSGVGEPTDLGGSQESGFVYPGSLTPESIFMQGVDPYKTRSIDWGAKDMTTEELIKKINSTPPDKQTELKSYMEELQNRQTPYGMASPSDEPKPNTLNLDTPAAHLAELNATQKRMDDLRKQIRDALASGVGGDNESSYAVSVDTSALEAQWNYENERMKALNVGENPGVSKYTDGYTPPAPGSEDTDTTDTSQLDWGINQKQINQALAKGRFYTGGVGSDGTPITSVNDGFAGVDSALRSHTTAIADSNNRYIGALNNELAGRQSNFADYSANRAATTAERKAALSDFMSAGRGAQAELGSNLSAYLGETDGLMAMRQGAGWGADVVTDPRMLAQQQAAMDALVQEAVAGGATQQEAIDFARKQIQEGGRLQQQVFDKQWGLTDPTNTAQERQVLDQNMRAVENRQRAVREAALDQLARRGLKSGDAMLASQQGGAASTDSMMAQGILGAQAQAVGRSQQALRDAGTTATSMRDLDQGAIQLFGNTAMQKRTADQNAQANRMQGATDMRSASDDLAMFNKEGSQTALRWQDEVAMRESDRVGQLAGSRADARDNKTMGVYRIDSDMYTSRDAANDKQEESDKTFYTDGNEFYAGNSKVSSGIRDAEQDTADTGVEDAEGILQNSGNYLTAVNGLDDIDPILDLATKKVNAGKIDEITAEDERDK